MPALARGYSLVELLVASALGLLVIAAAGQVFLQGSRAYRETERTARLRDDARFALEQLQQDLEMAGWWGGVRELSALELDAAAGPAVCAGTPREALRVLGAASAATAHAQFPCIAQAEFHAGTNGMGSAVIAIQHVAGAPTHIAARVTGHLYLNVIGGRGMLLAGGATSGTREAPHFEYRPAIWYLRRYSVSPGEPAPLPALCRKLLAGSRMQSDSGGCVAQGIEDLQVDLALDEDGDGYAERWKTVTGMASSAAVMAVRVRLRARTQDAGREGVRRLALSGLVLLRNSARRAAPAALP